MSETTHRNTTRIEPDVAWTMVTDSPLKGLAFAREAGLILAWDEGDQLYLLTTQGETASSARAPGKVTSAAISDDGSLIALLCERDGAGLVLMSGDFDIHSEHPAPLESSFVTTDPFGRYVAMGNRVGAVTLVNRYGKAAGRIETIQSMAHLCFIPDRPFLVGAAAFGMLTGMDVEPSRTPGRLIVEIVWQDRLMSNVGRLASTGDGSMILASCFTHGIQRFDLNGRNEGSYHLGGTVSHAVPDFPGRTIAAATLEGELAVMNSAGNVRWRTQLPRPAIALEIDPLGRFLIHGGATGEITRLDLFGPGPSKSASTSASGSGSSQPPRAAGGGRPRSRSKASPMRTPDWTAPAVQTEDQSETAVLAVTADPPRVAVFSSPNRLELFDATGRKIGRGPETTGAGRILRTAPGWLAAATDRRISLLDLRRNTQVLLDLNLVETTHLVIRPDSFGLAIVQERDRIGRATPAGRWVWKHELPTPVEDLAIGSEGFAAATTNDGRLLVFDPAGEISSTPGFDPSDPPLLVEAPEGSPPGVAWISFSRRAQQLTGHGLRGAPVWSRRIPWEGWSIVRLGGFVVASSADGRALAFDGSGAVRHEGGPTGSPNDVFFLDADGVPLRVARREIHVVCATLEGRVKWRMIGDQPAGPCAAGRDGVALMLGTTVAWFGNAGPTPWENG